MRRFAVCVLAFLLTSSALAQLTPGYVVRSGAPFPIVADFNADGLDDLIQETNVILNDGVSLTNVRDLGFPQEQRVVAALDVNADHRLDLITEEKAAQTPPSLGLPSGARGSRFRLYIADRSGDYPEAIDLATVALPAVGDLDGDGYDDILLQTPNFDADKRLVSTNLTVMRSLGNGTFEQLAALQVTDYPQLQERTRLQTADLDGDGIIDVVMRCPWDLVILHGTGGGKFRVESRYLPMDLGWAWWDTRVADIDGDSIPDIVMPVQRGALVLFGDGHGNFPRLTKTTVPKLHDIVGFPQGVPIDADRMNQPRDIAIGHFTRTDRNEIAAGMAEGDLVVMAYEDGGLREVSRTQTEFWGLDVRSGSFHAGGLDDIYVMGTLIWGDMYPRPRVFFGTQGVTTATSPSRRAVRRRATGVPPQVAFDVQITGGECLDATSQRWQFARDGAFGVARSGETLVESVFDGTQIFVRLTAPYLKMKAMSTLAFDNGVYRGTADAGLACGWKTITITATPE
jgi:hypothetical protein